MKTYLTLSILLISLMFTGITNAAWNPPAQNPPNGNTATPINVGNIAQLKTGGLTVATGGGISTGFVVLNGNVGIGVATPSASRKLHVAGSVQATSYCINSDCVTSWSGPGGPGGGSGTVTSITAGNGLTASPNPITSSGTISTNAQACSSTEASRWTGSSWTCISVTGGGSSSYSEGYYYTQGYYYSQGPYGGGYSEGIYYTQGYYYTQGTYPPPPTCSGDVILHEEINYSGACKGYSSGNYGFLANTGFNDKASSLTVKSGYTAVLFENTMYANNGGRRSFTSSDPDLTNNGANDWASSLIVSQNSVSDGVVGHTTTDSNSGTNDQVDLCLWTNNSTGGYILYRCIELDERGVDDFKQNRTFAFSSSNNIEPINIPPHVTGFSLQINGNDGMHIADWNVSEGGNTAMSRNYSSGYWLDGDCTSSQSRSGCGDNTGILHRNW